MACADDLRRYATLARCPVAIIRIAGSSTLTIEEALRLAGFWSDARVIEVDARLLPEIENPAGLARAILDFAHASLGV
ncbi:MAG: hypothetical protein ACT4P5_15835 [Armatimonadota bacterium]